MGSLSIISGDLFEQDVDAFVNAVNCVGVMGAGIALEFKRRFPRMFEDYALRWRTRLLRPGIVHVAEVMIGGRSRHVLNVPTKLHWRDDSSLEIVELGLAGLVDVVKQRGFASIAMPALGCGLGGLALRDVMPLMESAAQAMSPSSLHLVVNH